MAMSERLWAGNNNQASSILWILLILFSRSSDRYRRLPDALVSRDARGNLIRNPLSGHALRAAINTPIQGSAADIVMMAMLKLWKSSRLKDLGWKLLLQIHDEVILEGPVENRDEVCMLRSRLVSIFCCLMIMMLILCSLSFSVRR